MPKFLEDKLKKEYGEKSDIPYKVMNKMGVLRGNKITAKGKAMEAKHEAKKKPHRFGADNLTPSRRKSDRADVHESRK